MIQKIIFILSSYRDYVLFTCCILFSVILLFSQNSKQILALRASGAEVFSYVEKKFTVFTHSFKALKENQELHDQYQTLLRKYQATESLQWENKRLLEMLEYKRDKIADHVLARVIGKGTYQNMRYIKLDVGKKDGIKVNYPVVTHKGLVGRVYAFEDNICLCQTIADKNFRVSVRDMNTRTTGILRWYSPGVAKIEEIPKQDHIDIGDKVVTSGYSDIFPDGINLGEIIRIEPGARDELTKPVFVRLSENLRDLEFVFVIEHSPERN